MYDAVTKPDTPKGRFISYETPVITKETINACPEKW
jgi:ribose transport system substrate-binding protein